MTDCDVPQPEFEGTPAIFAGMLLAVGTVMVFSASMTARPSDTEQIFLSRHLLFVAIGLSAATVSALLPHHWWPRLAPLLFLGTIAGLVLVLMPGFGKTVNGAQRWLRVGPLTIQPSEMAKVTLPLMLAVVRCWFAKRQGSRLLELVLHGLLMAVTLGLILIQPDLGTTLFIGMACVLLLFVSGWPIIDFVIAGGLAIPAATMLLALKPYQLARIRGFLDAWQRPEQAPYQIQQSLTTLGVGGWHGTGLGQGNQKLSFLPEANTDFIFAVVGEELGLIGTLGIVGLWAGFYYVCAKRIRQLPEKSFASMVSQTLLLQLVLQAAINIAVVLALVPPKGIPHPFLSYGGSSLVTSCLMVGMILGLTRLPATNNGDTLHSDSNSAHSSHDMPLPDALPA
ncbi:MAG: cell division protein FtsW [Planctomycetaceae bacterium]|nr:cell division protein FtsW [Planctomycetaceae bacterium]